MLLAVGFTVAAGLEIKTRIQSATYNREVYPEYLTEPLGDTEVLDYEFSAQHKTLKGLWVFFNLPPNASFEGRLDLAMRRVGEDRPFWSQSFAFKKPQMVFGALLCRVEGLSLKKGERYVLTYAMPDTKAGDGCRLRYSAMKNVPSTIKWGSQVRQSAEPSMLWLERQPHYPLIYMLASVLLLAICSIGAGKNTSFTAPALLIMAGGCILLGVYHWQLNLWQFWGNFWPDGYPGLSHKFHAFFTGQIPFKDCLAYFDNDRCGQAFFVPVVMAVFQVLGLSIKGAYLATNAVFFVTAAVLLLGLLRLNGITDDRPTITAGLLFFSHRCFIGAVGELQTDLAGVAATLFFIYALLRAFATEKWGARLGWYVVCGGVGFLACTIRIALLALPLVPACLFLWSVCCERQRTWRERIAYLLPTLTGATLLWVCWWSLGLWGTFDKNWAFAKKFAELSSWNGFAISTLQGMQFSLLIVVLLWRRLYYDREFTAVAGSAFSLLALLACAHQPPWLRYWSPAAALGVILFIWVLKEWPKRECVLLAVAWIGALFNGLFSPR